MRFLFDIGHPAHVHYYKNLAKLLCEKGHNVFWTTKPIPTVLFLLDIYDFKYHVLPRKRDGLFSKIFFQAFYDLIVLIFCLRNKIDIAIGTSVTIAHISRLTNVRSLVFDDDDDEVQPLVTNFVHPYVDVLLSPDCIKNRSRQKATIYYPGYHELAYLHPNRFIPDKSILSELSMNEDDTFFVLRFNVFKAHHDRGIRGFTIIQKLQIINVLVNFGKVFITTEREIEKELEPYQLRIRPDKIHSLLCYSKLFIGDSQTMASEAAILGVPSIRLNSFAGRISYLEEQEKKYGLTYAFLPEQFDRMIVKLNELLSNPNLKIEWQQKRQKMLHDKIDVTSFWAWFISNYPDTISKIKQEPEFWEQFR